MASRSGIILVVCAVLLVGLGITMLASTNYYLEPGKGGGETYKNVWGQLRWLGLGVLALSVAAATNYQHLNHLRWWILGLTLVAMLACLWDVTGREVNGARRWLSLPGGLGGQPSEFAKIALVVALAAWYARHQASSREFLRGTLIPLLILAAVLAAFWFQRDLGNAILTGVVALAIMFTAGTRVIYLAAFGLLGIGLAVLAVLAIPNRLARVKAYLDPANNDMDLQQWVSQLAFGSGGLAGRGLGEGRMKLSYLPEAHTDFIFPMVGEELGFAGTGATVLLFVLLIVAGMCISAYAPDRFGKLLGMGLTTLLASEALMNMGVTTALLPNKGLPLPFVSYGGSALLAACLVLGILLNIHRQGVYLTRDQLPVIRKKSRWTPQM
jgi:cell division protein FtsW